jgi:hypothetical protein
MTNNKARATKIEKGVYDYRGWRITSRRITSDRPRWLVEHLYTDQFFRGHFISLRDAKDWIDEIL